MCNALDTDKPTKSVGKHRLYYIENEKTDRKKTKTGSVKNNMSPNDIIYKIKQETPKSETQTMTAQ